MMNPRRLPDGKWRLGDRADSGVIIRLLIKLDFGGNLNK